MRNLGAAHQDTPANKLSSRALDYAASMYAVQAAAGPNSTRNQQAALQPPGPPIVSLPAVVRASTNEYDARACCWIFPAAFSFALPQARVAVAKLCRPYRFLIETGALVAEYFHLITVWTDVGSFSWLSCAVELFFDLFFNFSLVNTILLTLVIPDLIVTLAVFPLSAVTCQISPPHLVTQSTPHFVLHDIPAQDPIQPKFCSARADK